MCNSDWMRGALQVAGLTLASFFGCNCNKRVLCCRGYSAPRTFFVGDGHRSRDLELDIAAAADLELVTVLSTP